MADLLQSHIDDLKRALAEATKTEEINAPEVAKRFVSMRTGIESKLSSRRSQLLAGRRGTGKSTLLYVVRKKLEDGGSAVATVDMEQYKGREYPDVLIEILRHLIGSLKPRFNLLHLRRNLVLGARRRALVTLLDQTLNDPQSLTKTLSRTSARGRSAKAGATLKSPIRQVPVEGSGALTAESSSALTASAEYEERKIERLQQLAPQVIELIRSMVKTTKTGSAFFFVDDYSYVSLADQPYVLGYLQQVTKGTGVYLKIGGIGTRLRPFLAGDPPIGMDPNHDVDRFVLDVSLEEFTTAKQFLENVMDGIAEPFGLSTQDIFTDIARNRMVLACGGAVARDYIKLTDSALDEALERLARKGKLSSGVPIRIESGDVHRAVRKRVTTKESESLDLDAATDQTRLRKRWRDVCDFARAMDDTAFVLFKAEELDATDWGAEVLELENLRLLHRVGINTPNTASMSGVKVVIYMIDLGQIAKQRLSKGIIEFWQGTAQSDKLRRKKWIYAPDWREVKALADQKAEDAKAKRAPRARSSSIPAKPADAKLF